MGVSKQRENPDLAAEFALEPVALSSVVRVHSETALVKVGGRWLASTQDDRLHTFESAEGVSEVGERIIELVDGVKTVEQIVESIVEEFDVSRALAEQDTRQFIGLLIAKHVLRVV